MDLEITRQENQKLKSDIDRLTAVNESLQRQLDGKTAEMLEFTRLRTSLNLSMQNLFQKCKKLTGELARVHAVIVKNGMLPVSKTPENEINFERGLTQLQEIVFAFKVTDNARAGPKTSVLSSGSHDLSLDNLKTRQLHSFTEKYTSSPSPQRVTQVHTYFATPPAKVLQRSSKSGLVMPVLRPEVTWQSKVGQLNRP